MTNSVAGPADQSQPTTEPFPALEPGETVDLELRGLQVAWTHKGETTFVLPTAPTTGEDDVRTRYLSVNLGELPAGAVTVTRAVPLDGRPQPGDVWKDTNGAVYFATKHGRGGNAVGFGFVAIDGADLVIPWRDVHNGPYGPIRLAYRPDPPAQPEAAPVCARCKAELHLDSEQRWVDPGGYATCDDIDAHQLEE